MRRARSLGLTILSLGWVALIAGAPRAAFGVPTSGAVYAFGSLICHQRPDRSFDLAGAQLPVCARCLGLYMGVAVGALGTLVARKRRATDARWPARDSWRSASPLDAARGALSDSRPSTSLGATLSVSTLDAARGDPEPVEGSKGRRAALRGWRLFLMASAIPTIATWAAEVTGLASFSNVNRFLAALPLGAAVAITVNYAECVRRPLIESRLPRTPI